MCQVAIQLHIFPVLLAWCRLTSFRSLISHREGHHFARCFMNWLVLVERSITVDVVWCTVRHFADGCHLLHGAKVWSDMGAKHESGKYVQHGVAHLITLLPYACLYPCHSGILSSSLCIINGIGISKESLIPTLRSWMSPLRSRGTHSAVLRT